MTLMDVTRQMVDLEPGTGAKQRLVSTSAPTQELNRLYSEFVQLAGGETDRTRFLLNLVQRVVGLTNALAGVFFVRDEDDDLSFGPRLLSRELLEQFSRIDDTLAEIARRAVGEGHAFTEVLDANSNLHAVVVPVLMPDAKPEVFCLVVRSRDLQPFVALLQLACGYVNYWNQARQVEQLDFEAGASASIVELVTRVQQAEGMDDACLMLANELGSYFRANRAAVGLVRGGSGQCRLQAVSETSHFDGRNKLAHAIEGVFSEAGGFGEPSSWPDADGFRANAMMAHRKMQNLTGAVSVMSAPLHDINGDLVAVVVLWWLDEAGDSERNRRLLGALDRPLGACLELQSKASRPAIGRRRGRSGSGVLRRVAITAALLAALSLLYMPAPHRIDSGALISPVNQRVVSAPFAGIVESSAVEVGDVVAQDDRLAEFDGREFTWRLDELHTELDRLAKKRDVALADGDATAARIGGLEMKRVGLKIDLLQNKVRQLDIRAPISGVVLVDALDRREGSPVEKGQVLFEVAPLERLRAEVEIPVEDISHITEGMPVELIVDSFPGRSWNLELARVLPRAENRDGSSVFVSEIPIDESIDGLMPGMRGEAKLYAGEKALGWVLFHKPWEQFRTWVGWVDPVQQGIDKLPPAERATSVAPTGADYADTTATMDSVIEWFTSIIRRTKVWLDNRRIRSQSEEENALTEDKGGWMAMDKDAAREP